MHTRLSCILLTLVLTPACGSRRIAGYLEELEDGSQETSETGAPFDTSAAETTHDSTSTGDPDTSGGGAGMTSTGPDTPNTSTSTSSATDETTGTTSEPAPECGNGIVEAFAAEPEECDDGNLVPDDGCSDTCARDVRVFVTSVEYPSAELKSLYIANALCANLADDQGWPDALSYRAWLSDSTTDARDRFKRGRGRLVMANGLVLAGSWDALLAGELQNNFEVTENSETYHGGVWTGTRPDGTAVPGAQHCDDWSTNSFLKTGHYGYSDRTTPEWTLSASFDNPISCGGDFAIYCFQSL